MRKAALAVWMSLAVAVSANAGLLRFGECVVDSEKVTAPVRVEIGPEDRVAALNFTLNYDPRALGFGQAAGGQSAIDAAKSVTTNILSPGRVAVVVVGLNQTPVTSGEIARIELRRLGNSSADRTALAITETTFASPEAQEIPSEGSVIELQLKQADESGAERDAPPPERSPGTRDRTQPNGLPVASPSEQADASPTSAATVSLKPPPPPEPTRTAVDNPGPDKMKVGSGQLSSVLGDAYEERAGIQVLLAPSQEDETDGKGSSSSQKAEKPGDAKRVLAETTPAEKTGKADDARSPSEPLLTMDADATRPKESKTGLSPKTSRGNPVSADVSTNVTFKLLSELLALALVLGLIAVVVARGRNSGSTG